ncbi:MAG: ABC transporter substrate-binding protein, partial [Chloroflexota bacterium]|nr:ABC transporter substrate-binding protein [Chloroflexota bacterium]
GKKIGVFSKGSTNEYFVDVELKRAGLKPTDVNLVELNAGNQAAAFANKAIDVAQGAEPTATVYADRGLAVKWLPASDIAPNFQYTFLLFSQKFADQKTDLAMRFMVAYLRGTRDWQQMLDSGKDKDQIFSYVSKYTPLKDRALFDRTGQPVLPPNPRIDKESIRKQEDWAKERGLVSQEPPVDKIVDTRFIDAAMQKLGPYQSKK